MRRAALEMCGLAGVFSWWPDVDERGELALAFQLKLGVPHVAPVLVAGCVSSLSTSCVIRRRLTRLKLQSSETMEASFASLSCTINHIREIYAL